MFDVPVTVVLDVDGTCVFRAVDQVRRQLCDGEEPREQLYDVGQDHRGYDSTQRGHRGRRRAVLVCTRKTVFDLTNPKPDSDSDFSDSVNPSIQCANPHTDSRI